MFAPSISMPLSLEFARLRADAEPHHRRDHQHNQAAPTIPADGAERKVCQTLLAVEQRSGANQARSLGG
jgi:hypothetical protein